jgi:hypothetical protein
MAAPKDPILSIVVPVAEVDKFWLKQLLRVRGSVEFVLVYPPGSKIEKIKDLRVKQIISPLRGEVTQRLVSIINSRGKYLLSINDDELVHPDILNLVQWYFTRFKNSWVVVPRKKGVAFQNKDLLKTAKWAPTPRIKNLEVVASGQKHLSLLQIPIVPIDKKKLDFRLLFFGKRKDQYGAHIENSDHRIWKADLLRNAAFDLIKDMNFKAIKYMPFWCMDRLLSLYVQAKYFKKGIIIGHRIIGSDSLEEAQLRVIDIDPLKGRHRRFYVAADALLLRRFPKYAYFWNLVISGIYGIPYRIFNRIKGS